MIAHWKSPSAEVWLIHSLLLGISFVLSVISDLLWGSNQLFGLLNNLIWIVEFTLIAWIILSASSHLQLAQRSLGFTIGVSVCFSVIASLLSAAISLAISLSLFWQDFYQTAILPSHTNPYKLITFLILGRAIFFQPFVFAWIFIYISLLLLQKEKHSALRFLRVENKLKEAQLNSLASQLNPHFLFNTLNNIKFMMRLDTAKSGQMLTSLSEVLRYSLNSSQCETVTLQQELEIVERYLMIMKIQLEERLVYSLNTDRAHLSLLVPPMCIQMLVENAIKHSLEHIQGQGQLRITTQVEGQGLLISVANDLAPRNSGTSVNLGIGLANITERLNLLYGDSASLRLQQNEQRFTAALCIPTQTADLAHAH